MDNRKPSLIEDIAFFLLLVVGLLPLCWLLMHSLQWFWLYVPFYLIGLQYVLNWYERVIKKIRPQVVKDHQKPD